jgi:hypothetical protein
MPRKASFNLDLIWAAALIGRGILTAALFATPVWRSTTAAGCRQVIRQRRLAFESSIRRHFRGSQAVRRALI